MSSDLGPAPTKVTFCCCKRGSDKVCHVAIKPKADGFVLTFAYGRRGGPLTTAAKTLVPVPFGVAKKLYDKLVKATTAKGYVADFKPRKS